MKEDVPNNISYLKAKEESVPDRVAPSRRAFPERFFGTVLGKLSEEATPTFNRWMAVALFVTLGVAESCLAYDTWQKATFNDRFAQASLEDQIKMLRPLRDQVCSSINLMTAKTGLVSDTSDCLKQKSWALEQISSIEARIR